MPQSSLLALPDPQRHGAGYSLDDGTIEGGVAALDAAEMILWGSYCGVHTIFKPEMVQWWQARGWRVLVHPESPLEVVRAADGSGSTNYLWQAVLDAQPGDKLVIGTEGHFVRNAVALGAQRGVRIVHLADIPAEGFGVAGCGCATMSRNDPPHLAGMLDLLRKGTPPEANRVLPATPSMSARACANAKAKPNERSSYAKRALRSRT